MIGIQPVGIARRKFRHLAARAPLTYRQIAAIRCRQEIGQLAMQDLQPMRVQLKIGDDLRLQQRHRVTGDGVAEAGMEFLCHRRAAHQAAAFQHRHAQAGARQIEGANQPVMAGADDQHICILGRTSRQVAQLHPS